MANVSRNGNPSLVGDVSRSRPQIEANLHSPRAAFSEYSVPSDAAREFRRETIIAELKKQAAAARAAQRRTLRRLLRNLWVKFASVGRQAWAKSVRTT